MRLIDADALRDCAFEVYQGNGVKLETIMVVPLAEINNAPTVEAISLEVHEKAMDVAVDDLFKVQEELNRIRNEKRQGEWIPVSERLPESRDWYLGLFKEPDTDFIGIPYICDYVGKVTKGTTKEGWILRGFTDIDNANNYTKSLECVAWQPLPEPYKKGGME